jgi:hypothetical protein
MLCVKFSHVTIHGCTKVWYHNLKHDFIFGLYNLYVKLISHLSTSILDKKKKAWLSSLHHLIRRWKYESLSLEI